jgi:hypothetical protein
MVDEFLEIECDGPVAYEAHMQMLPHKALFGREVFTWISVFFPGAIKYTQKHVVGRLATRF